jgi:serine/threonine protein kinase/Tfp pilus assembly protein PilF
MTNTPEDAIPTGDLTPRDPGPTGDFGTLGVPAPTPSPAADGATERSGDSIGPYKLLEVIGEGGFGVVYLAERREPMVQRVALKVIKPGMDSKAVVARFEQERQALAVMDHPNVARVFDGGVTASGRPYFVMEYVKGETLTAYADRKRLTLRERLELFIPICEAVQHAHHKGLIHRDLKPSNVLVAEVEGKPAPKVIDFGVAKAMAGEGWTDTAHTQSGVVIGTPLYMSPEQVAGETDVDTRADVYSLGVMLYELLTGEVPFDPGVLRKAALAEIQRIIREVTPPKPSTRVAQLADARTTALAVARSASRERIAGELRRELDWIPLMALRKERERRYASPQALADDVRRYLDGRPLRAAPDSKAYLARKFVRRNRVQVLAAAVVFLALTAGLVVALWQRNEAIRAKDAEAEQRAEAESQRTRADERADAAERAEAAATVARDAEKERADQLKKVSDFQSGMLGQIDATKAGIDLMKDVRERFAAALEKAGVPEADRTARVDALQQELVRVNATDAAAAMIDRTILKPAIKTIDEQFKDQPEVDAQLRQALGELYFGIGLYDSALPFLESALATQRAALGNDHPSTIVTMNMLGLLLRFRGELERSHAVLTEALDRSRRVLGEDHRDSRRIVNNIALVLRDMGRYSEAEPLAREVLSKARRLEGDDDESTMSYLNNLGILLISQGVYGEAEAVLREALERRRRVFGEEDRNTLKSMYNYGALFWARGDINEAEPHYREALERRRRVLGEEHPETIESISALSALLHSQRRFSEAEAYCVEAVDKFRRVLGEDHPSTIQEGLNLATLYLSAGRRDEAEATLKKWIAKARVVMGETHSMTLSARVNMAELLQLAGRAVEAEAMFREILRLRSELLGEDHPLTLQSLHSLGLILRIQGRLPEAEAQWRELLDRRRRVLGPESRDTLLTMHSLAAVLVDQGRLDEAVEYCREVVEKRRRTLGEADFDTLRSIALLGHVEVDLGRFGEAMELVGPAEPLARSAFIDGQRPRLGGLLTTLARARLGVGYDAVRFALAEANLLEAHPIYVAAKDRGPTHKDTLACVRALVDLYTAWNTAEPGKGYDAKAAEWKAKLSPPKAD